MPSMEMLHRFRKTQRYFGILYFGCVFFLTGHLSLCEEKGSSLAFHLTEHRSESRRKRNHAVTPFKKVKCGI